MEIDPVPGILYPQMQGCPPSNLFSLVSLNYPQQLRSVFLESRVFIFGHPYVAPGVLQILPITTSCSMLWCGSNKYSCAVCFSSIKIEIQKTARGTPEVEVNLMYKSFLKCLFRKEFHIMFVLSAWFFNQGSECVDIYRFLWSKKRH